MVYFTRRPASPMAFKVSRLWLGSLDCFNALVNWNVNIARSSLRLVAMNLGGKFSKAAVRALLPGLLDGKFGATKKPADLRASRQGNPGIARQALVAVE